MLTRTDKALIACILCGAIFLGAHNLLLPFRKTAASLVEVRIRGEKVAELSLTEENTFLFHSGANRLLLEIRGGRVRMAQADCPDQLCVRHGWISRTGGAIVCLPNQFVAEIRGESFVDGVSK